MRDKRTEPAEVAWGMFERTGDINYYRLYKKLKGLE